MKVVIDKAGCVGHARCQAVAPDLYELDDLGYIDSTGFDVPEGQESMARRGARSCPEKVIKTEGDPSGTDWPPA